VLASIKVFYGKSKPVVDEASVLLFNFAYSRFR